MRIADMLGQLPHQPFISQHIAPSTARINPAVPLLPVGKSGRVKKVSEARAISAARNEEAAKAAEKTKEEEDDKWMALTQTAPSTPSATSAGGDDCAAKAVTSDSDDIMNCITKSPAAVVDLTSPKTSPPPAAAAADITSPETEQPKRSKKKLMSSKQQMRPKTRGTIAKAAQSAMASKKKAASNAKAKLLKWAKGVGTSPGYKMPHGRRAPSNIKRDSKNESSKAARNAQKGKYAV